jgi:hypothetical protein
LLTGLTTYLFHHRLDKLLLHSIFDLVPARRGQQQWFSMTQGKKEATQKWLRYKLGFAMQID